MAARFVDALQPLERDGEVEPLASLYKNDGVAGNVLHFDDLRGVIGPMLVMPPDGGAVSDRIARHQVDV